MAQQGSVGGQWAQQQKEGLKRQEKGAKENEARRVVEGGEADRQSQQQQGEKLPGKQQGGAGEPQTSKLEPEKQGGIGGP